MLLLVIIKTKAKPSKAELSKRPLSTFLAATRELVFPSQQPLRRLAKGQFPGLAHFWGLARCH